MQEGSRKVDLAHHQVVGDEQQVFYYKISVGSVWEERAFIVKGLTPCNKSGAAGLCRKQRLPINGEGVERCWG